MDINVIISEIQDIIEESPVHVDLVSNFDSVTIDLKELWVSLKKKNQLFLAEDPDHPLISSIKTALNNIKLQNQYKIECKSKSQL